MAQIMKPEILQTRIADCADESGLEFSYHTAGSHTSEKTLLSCGIGDLDRSDPPSPPRLMVRFEASRSYFFLPTGYWALTQHSYC